MMELTTIEALIRAARVVAGVTGALVAIDSVGILLLAVERPSHYPKWSAAAWLIASVTIVCSVIVLLEDGVGLVTRTTPLAPQIAVLAIYIGMTAAFVTRALSRAHRPWCVAASVVGMSTAGVLYTIGGF